MLLSLRQRKEEQNGHREKVAYDHVRRIPSHQNRERTYHSINWDGGRGTRCWIKYAAGSPEPKVIKPRILKVHAVPMLSSNPLIIKLMTAPPRPPAAYTMPFAMPRLALKY